MGIGMILAGLASVIIGQAVFGTRLIGSPRWPSCSAPGVYRVVIQLALQAGLEPNDMKLVSAVLVVIALVLPQWKVSPGSAGWEK